MYHHIIDLLSYRGYKPFLGLFLILRFLIIMATAGEVQPFST